MQFQRIHIELTNNCNFSCQFCPDSLMTRERGNIGFNLLAKVLDEISQEKLTDQVLFHVMGEPTLYPDLFKAVNYAKDRGLKVHLTTNGSMLRDEILDQLLSLDIDHILFSVQTPDEKSFGLRRANIDFHEYKKRVTLSIAKILEKSRNTIATISFLTTPFKWLILPSRKFSTVNNKNELMASINFWIEDILNHLGGNGLKEEIINGLRDLRKSVLRSNLLGWNRFKITGKFFVEARPIGDWIHPALSSEKLHRARIGCCEGLDKHFGILWNGDLVFCCVDFDGKTAFANISKGTIKEALQNEKAQAASNGFKKLRVNHPYCQRCLGNVSLTGSLARQVGSILYFKWYRQHWPIKTDIEKAVLHA